MTETPDRYVPDERDYEKKRWLQEKYWGELLSTVAIAEMCDTSSRVINVNLQEFGIPRRANKYTKHNSVSPFTGFYGDTAARTDKASRTRYEEDYDDGPEDHKLKWQKVARKDDSVGDKAIIDS